MKAAIATFKPAHAYDKQKAQRHFFVNNDLYELISNIADTESDTEMLINSTRLSRITPDAYFQPLPICFAPLEKIIFNTYSQAMMCCDTKDWTLGKTPPVELNHYKLSKPRDYYLAALNRMLDINSFQSSCIVGCNSYELNQTTYDSVKDSPVFQQYMSLREISPSKRIPLLVDLFRNG